MQVEFNGFFPFIHRIFGEQRASAILSEERYGWDIGGFYQTNTAGIKVNENTALKQSAYWRAINLLGSQMASFPLGLFRRLDNGDTEEIFKDPGLRLLTRQPNNIMTPFIWRESTQANVLVNGNGYSFIDRERGGTPIALKPLDPTQVEPKTNGDILVYDYAGQAIDPYFMLHIPGLSFDGVKGKAVLQVAAENMGVGLAMQKYSSKFFENGAKQSGVLMHPGKLSTPAKDGVRTSFNKKMKDKEGGTMVLEEGMKYVPLSIPPHDQQLLESKQFSIQDMARWFGVPPYLLFEESRSTFTNIENQGAEFVRYTLTQWVERWEGELDAKLLTEAQRDDHFYKFNMNSLLRGSPKDRATAYKIFLDYGIFNIDEVRALEDKNKLPNGQGEKHIVQLNRTTIDKIGEDENNGE